MEKRIKAWHFLPEDGKLPHGDGRKVEVGKTYSVEGDITICKNGLHGSRRLIDALQYSGQFLLEKVEIWGDVVEQGDKLVGRNRKCLALIDAKKIILWSVCHFAERAMKKTGWEDKRSWDAINTARRWLRGDATIDDVKTAADAAHAAYSSAYAADAAYAAAYATHAAAYAAADAAHAAYSSAYAAYAAYATYAAAYATHAADASAYATHAAAYAAADADHAAYSSAYATHAAADAAHAADASAYATHTAEKNYQNRYLTRKINGALNEQKSSK